MKIQRDKSALVVIFFIINLLGFIVSDVFAQSGGGGFQPNISPPTGVSTEWPPPDQIMNLELWFNYAIYIGIVIVVLLLISILCCNFDFYFWCCRCCCGKCGGNRYKNYDPYKGKGYSKKDIRKICIANCAVYLILLVAVIVGVIFSVLFSLNIRAVLNNGLDTFDGVKETVTDTITTFGNITSVIQDGIQPIYGFVDEVEGLLKPLDNVKTLLQGQVLQDIDTLNSSKNTMTESLEKIQSTMKEVNNELESGGSVPDTPKFDDFDKNMKSAKNDIGNAIDSINQGKGQFDEKIQNQFVGVIGNITNSGGPLGDITSTTSELQTQLKDARSSIERIYNDQIRSDANYYSSLAENIRLAITIIFFLWSIILYSFAILGILLKKKWMIKLPACCTCFTTWIFFLVALIQIPVYLFVSDACTYTPRTIKGAADIGLNQANVNPSELLSQTFNASVTIEISQMIDGVAACEKDQNILQASFGENYLDTLGVSSFVDTFIDPLTENINQINLTEQIQEAVPDSSQFDISNEFNATEIFGQFDDFKDQLSSVNQTVKEAHQNATEALQTAVDTVNEILNSDDFEKWCTGPSGDYTIDTIDDFNSDNVNCNKVPPGTPDDKNPEKQLDELDKKIDGDGNNEGLYSAYQKTKDAKKDMRDVGAEMNIVDQQIAISKDKIDAIKKVPPKVEKEIDKIKKDGREFVENLVDNVKPIARKTVYSVVNTVVSPLKCGWIGNIVSTLDVEVCSGIVPQSLGTGISSFVIGILMSIMFTLLLVAHKYVAYEKKYDAPDKGYEMDQGMENPNQKSTNGVQKPDMFEPTAPVLPQENSNHNDDIYYPRP